MPRTDLFRVTVSSVVSALFATGVMFFLAGVVGVEYEDPTLFLVTAYLVLWPVYTAIYATWSTFVYSRLDGELLKRVTVADESAERSPIQRFLGVTGATNTTISAAVAAVAITIVVAQQPEFRSDAIYVGLALLTVASSWVLMVFSFAQSYLRLGAGVHDEPHLKFHFPEAARFSDYLTLAVLLSTMAATVPADISSRTAWRVVRSNVIIAFVFNSVIIAMMVSLLFGRLLAG
ncbi:DUF1345 domain-containing protein [Glaciihabitans arcticus]|nr:DUF1345 domain-containing protein [Glaciihabitans arcticus]